MLVLPHASLKVTLPSVRLLAVIPLLASLLSLPATAQVNTQRGATVGGIAGAVAGAAIGEHHGETGAGAAIGGIVGAFAGGLFGNAEDREQAFRRQQQYQLRQQRHFDYQRTAVSATDVVAMTRSGLSENVIINQIRQRGILVRPQVADIIALHQQGVSETVITAMQQAQHQPIQAGMQLAQRSLATPSSPRVSPIIAPVENHHLVPRYYPPPCSYFPEPMHHHHRYPSGIHIRF